MPVRIPGALTSLIVCLLILVLSVSHARAQTQPAVTAESLTDEQVVGTLTRAIDVVLQDVDARLTPLRKLSSAQRVEPEHLGDAGDLMLETYALLSASAAVKDPRLGLHDDRMEMLIDIAIRADFNETYQVALQTLVLAQLPQTNEVRKAINHSVGKLIKGRGKAGGYSYRLDGSQKETYDGSNSQYGLLGTWAAADWGVDVPYGYWKETADFWRNIQLPSGGWNYSIGQPQTNSMTAAGTASLFVCEEYLSRYPRLDPKPNPALERGLVEMIKGFDPKTPDLYYLYGVERAGLASGARFFGKYDWYRQVAANIVREENGNSNFLGGFVGASRTRSACYTILILGRGRAPIVMNKLQYDGPWNARPRDAANLHARLARIYERHLNWQAVPINTFYQDWLDAPILLITGSKDPLFTTDQVGKLREYVLSGGTIFSTADGESQDFSDAMARYAAQMVLPGHGPADAAYRQLPPDHPLFQVLGKNANPPKLFGISNGIRELWIHSPQDLGAAWQSKDYNNKDAWDIPASLLVYTAGKEGLRSKLQSLVVASPAKPATRHTAIARLLFNGNCDPEPHAWPRLVQLMASKANTDITLQTVPIADLPKQNPMPVLAHLGGAGKFSLGADEQKALKDYIAAGGTLFIEAIGGNDEFNASANELLKSLYPEGKLKVIPPTYSLYTGNFSPDALKINEVDYRRYWTLQHGALKIPRIQYMTLAGRVGILYSAEDLTSGLLGTNSWTISGYTPDSAFDLARNIVLYAWRNFPKKPAAMSPAH